MNSNNKLVSILFVLGGAVVLAALMLVFNSTDTYDPIPKFTASPTLKPSTKPTTVPTTETVIQEYMYEDIGFVNTESLYVREGPSIDSGIRGNLCIGDEVIVYDTIIDADYDWYRIDGGYVADIYIDRGGLKKPGTKFNMNLQEKSGLTIDEINVFLKDGELHDLGGVIIYLEDRYNVNAYLQLAVAIHESGWGTSRIARKKDNLFGFGAYSHSPYESAIDYESKNESINDFVKLMRHDYFDKGYTNLEDIGKLYCESEDWPELIANAMKYLRYAIDVKS
jgi:Mannosyl-glycoprotein endo-beta-N-acetylglucosaminidase/Bacterial SH3 domain